MNINFKENKILSIGSNFLDLNSDPQLIFISSTQKPTWNLPKLLPIHALSNLCSIINRNLRISQIQVESAGQFQHVIRNVPFALSDIPVSLKYFFYDGRLELAWDFQLEMQDNWYHAHVSSNSGEVISLIDWVAHASYSVYPFSVNDPLSGDRTLVQDPHALTFSPFGWHTEDNIIMFNSTRGNNVIAQENTRGSSKWQDNYRPTSNTLNFDYPVNLTQDPSTYLNASIVNIFYWANMIHDLFYVYGFDEPAGNFQQINHVTGGVGNDAVICNAQDGSGFNNANFATPPDGQHGKMYLFQSLFEIRRMYLWDITNPYRDGDLESGIIVHEYGHGISTRLTGGGHNSGCLSSGESAGMGEGWGDLFATIFQMNPSTNQSSIFLMGSYANGGKGIRKFPYSTNMSVNPSTYGFIKRSEYYNVHSKGEVWAVILYEVYWAIVEKHGFDPDWFLQSKKSSNTEYIELFSGLKKKIPKRPKKPKKPKQPKQPETPNDPLSGGNRLFLQLIVDGMKLQPCYPSFIDARDAIIQADLINNNGDNECDLWRGFAKRGLGFGASMGGNESFNVPTICDVVDE